MECSFHCTLRRAWTIYRVVLSIWRGPLDSEVTFYFPFEPGSGASYLCALVWIWTSCYVCSRCISTLRGGALIASFPCRGTGLLLALATICWPCGRNGFVSTYNGLLCSFLLCHEFCCFFHIEKIFSKMFLLTKHPRVFQLPVFFVHSLVVILSTPPFFICFVFFLDVNT